MEGTLIKRSDKVAFMGVPGEGGAYTYHRMKGFTEISTSKNPIEYSRQYIDEAFETSDVTGYSPSISYSFDQYVGNAVHEDLAKISDDELVGSQAIRPIIVVDMTKTADNAVKRDFSVIPDSEGDSTDAYTYSGTFKVHGERLRGTAQSDDDWQTITFTEPGAGNEGE